MGQDNAREVLDLIRERLRGLGYDDQLIEFVAVTNDSSVDLVVYNSEREPWVAVEAKGVEFSRALTHEQLRFHPSVRRLQASATTLRAPFYALSDGKDFLWFTTDELGRPQLLDAPVVAAPSSATVSPAASSRTAIVQALTQLNGLVAREGQQLSLGSTDVATIVLAKVLSERGDDTLRRSLLEGDTTTGPALSFLTPIVASKAVLRLKKTVAQRAFSMLQGISFLRATPEDALAAIDEACLNAIKRVPAIPRWLATLMVRLSQLQDDSVLLDPCSNYGEILVASHLHRRRSQLQGISNELLGALWFEIQRYILGIDNCETRLGNALVGGMPESSSPSHVVSAPAFGTFGGTLPYDSKLFARGVRHSEDLYAELSLSIVRQDGRVVLLVPDNMLFAGGPREETRRLLIEQAQLLAIIGLEKGLLLPYTSIKTSILVLARKSQQQAREVFMTHLGSSATLDTSRVAAAFDTWTFGGRVDDEVWLVPRASLHADNLLSTFYRRGKDVGPQQPYACVPLEGVAQLIKRGTSLKLNEQGDISVIGPGAIRPLQIDPSGLGRTLRGNITGRPLIAEPGDVVVNNIGTYLGSSAVVDATIAGGCVSQHAILIRPDTSKVLSEYLAAVLNSKDVASQMQQRATGTVMASLTTRGLTQVSIPLPDIETQRKIANRITEAREKLIRARLALKEAEDEFNEAIEFVATGER